MDRQKIMIIWIAILTMSFSCNEKTSIPIQNEECLSGKILKSAKDRTGKVYYNSLEKKYAIHASERGTYDSQDIGFLCNPPDSLKKDGLSVTFDGDYYAYEKDRVAPVGGATYYYLQIMKLKTNKL